MSELEELIKQIEEIRLCMIKSNGESRSITDPMVIDASQGLDVVLEKYQELIMRN